MPPPPATLGTPGPASPSRRRTWSRHLLLHRCVVDGFEMSGKVNDAVDIKFDLVTKAVGNEAVSSVFTAITAANTNPLITSWDGTVKKAAPPWPTWWAGR